MGELMVEVRERVAEILAQVRPFAVEFCRLTGKTLGVTGEVGRRALDETLDFERARDGPMR